jgi:glycosyltransferase involved in cell wall biosynthesis
MKLAIITPSLGGNEADLKLCSETVYNSLTGYNGIHIVVCPRHRIAAVERWLSNSVVIAENNPGVYGAVDTGFKFACSNYDVDGLGYINDDDGMIPAGYRAMLKHFADQNAEAVCYGRVRYIDRNGAWLGNASLCKRPADLLALFAEGVTPITQQGMLFPSVCYKGRKQLDLSMRFAADSDWIVHNLIDGRRFDYVNEMVAFYRIRPGQLSGDTDGASREGIIVRNRALPHSPGWAVRKLAKYRFRLSNAATVLERVNRSGFQTTKKMFKDEVFIR